MQGTSHMMDKKLLKKNETMNVHCKDVKILGIAPCQFASEQQVKLACKRHLMPDNHFSKKRNHEGQVQGHENDVLFSPCNLFLRYLLPLILRPIGLWGRHGMAGDKPPPPPIGTRTALFFGAFFVTLA